MKTNVKGLERVVRIAVGAAVLGQAIGGYSVFEYGIVDEVVGVVLLGTGVLASCPLKSLTLFLNILTSSSLNIPDEFIKSELKIIGDLLA